MNDEEKMEKRNLAPLTITAANIAGVLLDNRVVGNTSNEKLDAYEQHSVSHSILKYAENEPLYRYLELTYPSCVRVIIKFAITADNNEVFIRDISAYDHPWRNENVDYKALNAQLSATIAC